MAAANRMASQAARSLTSNAFRSSTVCRAALTRRQQIIEYGRRGYASQTQNAAGRSNTLLYGSIATVILGGIGYSFYQKSPAPPKSFTPTASDYQNVYDAVAQRLIDEDDYDDGSYGPVVLRLGWHASGTYDKETGTGGSNGATMRFAPESEHGANSGLKAARDFLDPIKEQFPWISYSDLWTLSAACAVQEMGGPDIPWRPGRADRDLSFCTPDGRLPDGSKGQDHLRAIFYRMRFDDQEIVALSGAHALGRCHTDRSGFDGPWTFSPITLTNDFYKLLLSEKWNVRKWDGPRQFQDDGSKSLMMLPTDMVLIQDESFRPWVEKYAEDNDAFFADFSRVLVKLLELGVPFKSAEDARISFRRTE